MKSNSIKKSSDLSHIKSSLTLFLFMVGLAVSIFYTTPAQAESITLSASVSVEPYIFEKTNSGFEIDIVREALALKGLKAKFIYQPLLRTKISFKTGKVDAAMTVIPSYAETEGGYLSDEYITYSNVAITLKSRNLKIESIKDLQDKGVISFQQARYAFGKDFEEMTKINPNYQEVAEQRQQLARFFAGRTDVIVLDKYIFSYQRKQIKSAPDQLTNNIQIDQPIDVHDLFKPSSFRIAFKSKQVCDQFNAGLSELKKSGRYNKIIESYKNQLYSE